MKTKHFILVAFIAISSTLGVSAQEFQPFTKEEAEGRFDKKPHHMCEGLTDEQKALVDDLNKTHFKAQKMLRLEMDVLKAEQKALVDEEVPEIKKIEKKIDEIATLKAQMAKAKAAHMIELQKVLPEKHFRFNHNARHQKGNGQRVTTQRSNRSHAAGEGRAYAKKGQQHSCGNNSAGRFGNKDKHDMKGRMDRGKGMQRPLLSTEDKEAVKAVMEPMIKISRETKNQINILKAKQKLLMAAEEVDLKAINKNIDEIAKLEAVIMKEHIKARISLKDKLPLMSGRHFGMGLHRSNEMRRQGNFR